ncbi:CoA transferase [Siccirubricoccus sp. KC 17139]|uniref:CoA transferase n=1 Tax=Siccirubricoccus soli TaxID=2899147 RepID=A0ABT1D141_9PROT|nr:CoA transferase [Siccirubricoccus soli]MCO6415628.1 CoA transferase [Siccirubricoccus soli]MCP2681760.1 CoA transferase [Siccirubricoccus soli]
MPESPIDPKLMTETRLPLAGLRVLDLTLARAGPTCVRHLADWGADIIRVEPPAAGDGLGGARDGFDQVNLHRNKRGLSLDLKNPAGHAAFLRLAATADILVENMRMQVKHRLKIAYDDLKELNPRLIYASISGFGQTGPYSKRGGVDQIAQGMGGLMTITGEPGRGPMRVGIPINDLTAGNLLAMGIMMKLYDRERTGKGGYVHTSLLEAQVFMLDFQATRWLMDGEVPGQAGNDHPVNIPMGVFPTADKPINIAASSSKLWEAFCKAAGHEEWLEVPEWKTPKGRSADRARVNATIAEVTRTRPSEWWVLKLEEAGIPCGPVNNIREVFEDPQVQHLEMAMPMRHRTRGDIKVVAQPVNLEGVETGFYRDIPNLGEHNEEILREAGLSAAEIQELKDKGALGGG